MSQLESIGFWTTPFILHVLFQAAEIAALRSLHPITYDLRSKCRHINLGLEKALDQM